jgi:hypothetical protein
VYVDLRGYLEASSQKDKKCTAIEDSQVARLKHNCMTAAELELTLTQTIENAASTGFSGKVQKLISNDQQLVFLPLKISNEVTGTSPMYSGKMAQANAFLLPIGYKLVNGVPVQTEGGFELPIDLRKDNPDFPPYLGNVTGLADIAIINGSRLGRWSDALVAKTVTVFLAKPLPKKFTLEIRAHAAGLNTVKPMQIKIGKQTKELTFGSEFETKTVDFELDEDAYKIEFKPADPFSPARRWGSGDIRLIAVLFQQLQIVPK